MRTQILNSVFILMLFGVFGVYVLLHFPGYMSHDSTVHFRQVISGEWTTFQPVVFLMLWKLTNFMIAGPGGLFLLLLLIYMSGLLMLVQSWLSKTWHKMLVVFVMMLAPINFMLLPHIWKDVALMAFLMLSLGLFEQAKINNRRYLKVSALVSFALAMSFRFEAVLYLWPLAFYFFWSQNNASHSDIKASCVKTTVKLLGFIGIVFICNALMSQLSGAKKITLWPTMALWDLAAVSISENKNLMPGFATGSDMTVEDLQQAFEPWSNVPLLSKTKAGINTGIDLPYTDDEYKSLKKAWLQLPFIYTSAYLKHRWRLFKELLRINETIGKPKELYYVHKVTGFQAEHPKNNSVLNQKYSVWLKRNIDAFYFKPWLYLLLGLLACLVLIIRYKKGGQTNGLALCLSACTFLNVLVMLFLAPAAETRYLIVAMNFSLLLWVLVFSTDRS